MTPLYDYSKPVSITGSSLAGTLANYQKELVLHKAARPIADTGSWALYFTGGSLHRVVVADSASLDITDSITIEATIVPYAVAGYCTIVAKRYTTTAGVISCNYQLQIHDGKLAFGYYTGGVWYLWESTSAWLKLYNQYRVAIRFTFGTDASAACFINGQRVAGAWGTTPEGIAATANNYQLCFGVVQKQPSLYWADAYSGTIQEVRISNCLRTDAEIWTNARDDAEFGAPDANVMGLWHFNEGSGASLDDETAYNNDGTITGATWLPGYWANHVFLDGHVYSGTFADVRFTNAAGTLIDHWIDPDTILYGNKCRCYVEIDSIPQTLVTTIYIYYGKPGDTGGSSGDNTFDFYADFDASTIGNDGSEEGLIVDSGTWAVGYDSLYTNELSADPAHTKDPAIIKKATGEYYLFTTSGLSGQGIAVAKSYDKKHWVYLKRLWLEGHWNAWSPCLLEEGGICYMTAGMSIDSTFQDHSEIHLWSSPMTDLENWTFVGKLFGPANWGSSKGVMTSQICKFGSTYYMYYDIVNYDLTHAHAIGYATTTDAPSAWTSSSFTDQGMLFASSEAWEKAYVYCPSVNYVAGTYYMHYCGGGDYGGGTTQYHIGYATADAPGGPYTKIAQITLNATPDWCASIQANPHVLYQDDQWELWFHGAEVASGDHNINSVSYMVCTVWPTNWDVVGRKAYRQTAVADGRVHCHDLGGNDVSLRDLRIDLRCKGTSTTTNVGVLWHYYTSNNYCYKGWMRADTNVLNFDKYTGAWANIVTTSLAPYTNPAAWVFRDYKILHYYNAVQALYANGILTQLQFDASIPLTGLVKLQTYNEKSIFQFLRVGKYVNPEPTVTSTGSETYVGLGTPRAGGNIAALAMAAGII